MFGVLFGFLLGGFVYKAYYIYGVAIFDIIVLSIEARILKEKMHNPHTTRVCHEREPLSCPFTHIVQ